MTPASKDKMTGDEEEASPPVQTRTDKTNDGEVPLPTEAEPVKRPIVSIPCTKRKSTSRFDMSIYDKKKTPPHSPIP
jgi:hypothetical protein